MERLNGIGVSEGLAVGPALVAIQRTQVIRFAIADSHVPQEIAALGRARARLFLGDYPGARADAALVPAGFVYNVSASDASPRRQNRIADQNSAISTALSVGEPYRSMGDARIPVTDGGTVSATGVEHHFQTKYASTSTPIPLATYEEAQLIVAELKDNSL